ncbi:MAG: hypothetical protein ACRCYU_23370 [Nocardioides sp.]
MSGQHRPDRRRAIRPRRRRLRAWIGVLLILLALAPLGWAGWEPQGTTIVSKRAQAVLVERWIRPPLHQKAPQ